MAAKKNGRPFTYLDEDKARICAHVCDELAKGRSLSTICGEDREACSYSRFMTWQRESEDLQHAIAQAREAGATKLLEEIIAIGDDKSEDANSRKVRIYAREKYAAMIAPRRFGQRLDVTTDGKALPSPIAVNHDKVDALLALAMHRRLAAPIVDGETIDLDDVMR